MGDGGGEGIAGERGTEELAHWIRDKDKSSSSCIHRIERHPKCSLVLLLK
jgi:hypothetical protein